jgi:hypothetical protein
VTARGLMAARANSMMISIRSETVLMHLVSGSIQKCTVLAPVMQTAKLTKLAGPPWRKSSQLTTRQRPVHFLVDKAARCSHDLPHIIALLSQYLRLQIPLAIPRLRLWLYISTLACRASRRRHDTDVITFRHFHQSYSCSTGRNETAFRTVDNTRKTTSDIRHPTSDIRHPTSDIRHPTFQERR